MVKVIDFIFAARPMLLLPVWSIYLIVNGLIGFDSKINSNGFISLVGLTLLMAGAYFLNQIYDYKSDAINEKIGFLQSGKISRSEMMAGYISTSLIGLICGFYINVITGFLFIAIFIMGLLYSMPPFRFKDRPYLGILANAIGYGALIPMAVPDFWRASFNLQFYICAYFTFVVAGTYLLTLIPDRMGDLKTGKKTLAVRLSNRMLIFLGLVLIARSIFLGNSLDNIELLILSSISTLLYIVALIFDKLNVTLLACKFPILLITLLAGYYHTGYFVFIVVLLMATRIYYIKRFKMNYPRMT